MTGTNLVVPVVLWGKTAPTHCISSVHISRDQKTLITGCYDGQICLWHVDPDTLKMTPRCLLVGHTAPILCLAKASILPENNYIVSSSESGEMCTWDLVDGKCREVAKLAYVHTSMQAYHMSNCDDIRLFCNGYYAEVLVMDPFSLEVLFTLSSRVNPDWISALHVLKPVKRKDDVVLALTTTGTVKVWTLSGSETKASEPIYEHESKQIRCLNALSMSCCSQNQRTVLIVCSKYWQIYDAGDFSVLCSVISPRGERWLGGEFLSPDRVLVWTDEGKGYMYKLPAKIHVLKPLFIPGLRSCLVIVPLARHNIWWDFQLEYTFLYSTEKTSDDLYSAAAACRLIWCKDGNAIATISCTVTNWRLFPNGKCISRMRV